MEIKKVALIGGGKLGSSIAQGILDSDQIDVNLSISDLHLDHLTPLKEKGAQLTQSNFEAIKGAQLIILAVKPWMIEGVLQELKPELDAKSHVVSSVAAGITLGDLQAVLGTEIGTVRLMPNTAAAVREAITGITASDKVEKDTIEFIKTIFDQLGETVVVDDEKVMDTVTVLGGSGTGLAMRFIRAMVEAGIEGGLKVNDANKIAAQVLKGAGQLILTNESHAEVEIDKVTTPGGCTIKTLNAMERGGFSSAVIQGIKEGIASLKKA